MFHQLLEPPSKPRPLFRKTKAHICTLPVKDTTGLPKLPPNASNLRKLLRNTRKLFLLNPKNYKCKKLFRNKASLLTEKKRHASGPHSLVFHPLSLMSSYIDALFCVTWLHCLLFDPLRIYTSGTYNEIYTFLQSKVVFPSKIFIMAYFFNVGYVDNKTKTCVVDRRKIVCRYLKSYFFFDLASTYFSIYLSSLLTEMGFIKCSVEYSDQNDCFGYLYMSRLICSAVRIPSLFETIEDALANLRVGTRTRMAFIYVVKTFIIIHIFSFVLYFFPYMKYKGKWPKDSWLYEAKIDHHYGFRHQFGESLLTVICAFFAINYRFDMNLLDERIIIAVITLFGRLYTLYLLADVLTVFGIAGVSESMYERQLIALHTYMLEKDLPDNLRQRILRYYEYKFQKRYFRENIILATLSEHLRTDLFLYTARKLVQKVEFFKKLPNSTLGAIIAAMKAEIFSSNDIIIKIGSETDDIYFISTGTVAVTNANGIELCHLEDGEEFGSSCILTKKHMFAIVAVETTEVFSISKNTFLEFLGPHSEVMTAFHRSIKRKLSRYQTLEDYVSRMGKNLLDELADIVERPTRRFVTL